MNRTIVVLAACSIAVCNPAERVFPQDDAIRGVRRLDEDAATSRPRAQWALLIGVNYVGRGDLTNPADRSVLPPLRNAVKDAEGIRDVLTTYYNYNAEHITLLSEAEATKDAIETALGELCDPGRVDEGDSVVVFFSGHGVRLTGGAAAEERVAILPFDVQIAGGRPTGKFLRLHQDLFLPLKRCPAKHKLVILDSCYSGDIFHSNFQPRSETDDRSDERLQEQASFQAMASCRATQVASDGTDGHSPFTAALIEGLKRLPAQQQTDRVWANRLLAYIRPRFVKGNQQKPDCRSLIDSDGEFCFYPGDPRHFEQFRIRASEHNLLRAMVASRQGNWWFQEMPWFIPGVREQVIRSFEEAQEQTRTQDLAQFIDMPELRAAAQDASNQLEERRSIDWLRRSHFLLLLETHGTNRFDDALKRIADELSERLADRGSADALRDASSAPVEMPEFEPVDIHLLALVQHAQGRADQALSTYGQALQAYRSAATTDEHLSMHRILEAFCRADLAELLLEHLAQPAQAAAEFRRADERIASLVADTRQQEAAAVFRIFILCREADAWLQLNRWSEADDRLLMALDFSANLGNRHYLTAHVHRRRAWAEMMQWKIEDAECSFRRSNEILAALMEAGTGAADPTADDDPQPGARNRPDGQDPAACRGASDPFAITDAVRVSEDFPSKLAYLHNLHGIAMARRFKGDTAAATRGYRLLAHRVGAALLQLRDTSADADVEQQFVERMINTHERLGDCNLFGDPAVRDVKEAADDYRRAMAYVHHLRGRRREQWHAKLLYKQALAFAQPSPVQDTALGLEMCRRADSLYEEQKATASGLEEALGRLATPIVDMIDSRLAGEADRLVRGDAAVEEAAISTLRKAIRDFRDDIGLAPHRDQLELGLFASKLLLEQGGVRERYQVVEDTDLLLTFCRTALMQQRRAAVLVRGPFASDARTYLRPYYDEAMRSRLRASRNRVKELLEIHQEATQGILYVKPVLPKPILAIHSLDGDLLLLVDLPGGESRCVPLSEHCDVEALREAAEGSNQPLALPSDVGRLLAQWKHGSDRKVRDELHVRRWLDESWLQTSRTLLEVTTNANGADRTMHVAVQFPFELPDGFTEEMATGAQPPTAQSARGPLSESKGAVPEN